MAILQIASTFPINARLTAQTLWKFSYSFDS